MSKWQPLFLVYLTQRLQKFFFLIWTLLFISVIIFCHFYCHKLFTSSLSSQVLLSELMWTKWHNHISTRGFEFEWRAMPISKGFNKPYSEPLVQFQLNKAPFGEVDSDTLPREDNSKIGKIVLNHRANFKQSNAQSIPE